MRITLRNSVVINTSLTNVFTVSALAVGIYSFRFELDCVQVGPPTAFTMTPGFSGSATPISYTVKRYTAAGVAVATQTTFGAVASSIWLNAEGHGLFVVTAPGDLTIGCTRTGGTSSTIQVGGFLDLEQNAC